MQPYWLLQGSFLHMKIVETLAIPDGNEDSSPTSFTVRQRDHHLS